MEVTDNVVRVMESNVKASVGESNTSDTTHNKQEKERKSEKHRGVEIDVTTIDGSKSREDFDTSRHSNNHSSSGEVGTTGSTELAALISCSMTKISPRIFNNSSQPTFLDISTKRRYADKKVPFSVKLGKRSRSGWI